MGRTSLVNGPRISGNSASKPRQWEQQAQATEGPAVRPTAPPPSSGSAAALTTDPKRLENHTATPTTARCSIPSLVVHQNSYMNPARETDCVSVSDFSDAHERVDEAYTDVGLCDLQRESTPLVSVSAAARQADAVASARALNAEQENSAGSESGSMTLPPQDSRSPGPEDRIATRPAVMVEDDDVANADTNVFVAVRVRPRTSLLAAKGASSVSLHNAEQPPPRDPRSSSGGGGDWDDNWSTQSSTLSSGLLVRERQKSSNSTPSHSAMTRRRQPARTQATPFVEQEKASNTDSDDNASNESFMCVNAMNGFIDCLVTTAANVSGSASTPSSATANGAGSGQRTRILRFCFDNVLDDSVTQADVMARIGQRAVERVLQGYHSTVMCYGQTGSGKTYTIAGPHGGKLSRKALRWLASQPSSAKAVQCDDGNVDEEKHVRIAAHVGLLPRILIQLFHGLEARHGSGRLQQTSAAPTSSWQVALSAMELYNGDMRDLLPGELPENEEETPIKKDLAHSSIAPSLRHHGSSNNISNRRGHRQVTSAATSPSISTRWDGGVTAASAVKRGRGQFSASPLCAVSARTHVSQSASSSTTRNPPRAAANTTSATSNAGASTGLGPAKAMLKTWAASSTATQAPPPLQIRLGAPTPSALQRSPSKTLKKAKAVSPSPLSWASLRPPAHDTGSEAVHIEGLREHPVHDIHAAMEAVWRALRQRQMGSTEVNKNSSRSHAFFFVRVEQREQHSRGKEKPLWTIRRSTLSLVDLAGSERVGHTGAHGLQLKEAQNINLSLSALGNVMRLLSSASRPSPSKSSTVTSAGRAAARTGVRADQHIPYRDSKLTRILQSSLGGNAIVFLLCNVSPEPRDAQETMSTLRFAKLCKNVKSNVTLNEKTAGFEDTQTAAEARICQLVGDVSAMQNRLRQLATYTWWLENHLGYFAATITQQQRLSTTLIANTSMRATTSPSRSCVSGGSFGLDVPEEATAPGESSGTRRVGVENKKGADPSVAPEDCRCSAAPAGPTSPEWWHLSPRPSSPTAPVDNDRDGGGGPAEAVAYWRSASAPALLSPAYPIAHRRIALERKMITAAVAARKPIVAGTNPLETSLTANTVGTSTRAERNGVLMCEPSAAPISTRNDAVEPSPSMATVLSVPLLSLPANLKQPPSECPMSAMGITLAEERTAVTARLAEVEHSNLLLRLRLAELQRHMRQEGSIPHVAEDDQATNEEKTARRTVVKDGFGAPASLSSVSEANASSVLWPPHYHQASHDASLEVFLARCGFAAMDSMELRGGSAPQHPPRTRGETSDAEAMQNVSEQCDMSDIVA
ncbi:kinesin-like protein [Leishmania tarentolae]|uniref:Kinesin-like protein n=1 Tax=Leishmania tarentolae TaxID=5689 RepID=A0A640KDK0_LEITA|nr:kinesin-like protein [Leishmania tarentolae]